MSQRRDRSRALPSLQPVQDSATQITARVSIVARVDGLHPSVVQILRSKVGRKSNPS